MEILIWVLLGVLAWIADHGWLNEKPVASLMLNILFGPLSFIFNKITFL